MSDNRLRELEDSLEAIGVLRRYFQSGKRTVVEFEDFSIAVPLEALRTLQEASLKKGEHIAILLVGDEPQNPVRVRRIGRARNQTVTTRNQDPKMHQRIQVPIV